MQPVGNVLNKFPRVVRDMARGLGKEIRLEITGQDTEMDKTLIEGLSDPLTHMVRNAVDHGIEPADERSQAGKDRTGTIRIKASHEAGQVVISIADDGKGIDPEKISSAAINKGLIAQDSAKIMSDKEKMALVFLPGLLPRR
jgi:two-component system chemotaxis sensor kinase CheA